jgi:hypothetical protein
MDINPDDQWKTSNPELYKDGLKEEYHGTGGRWCMFLKDNH